MKKETVTYGLIGGVMGGLVVWLIISSSVNSNNTNAMRMMGMRTSGNPPLMGRNTEIDAHFIEQMIPHHEDAITMSKIALEKAKRPEVKTLAQNIIASQSKEIEQMEEWYAIWYGRQLPTGTEVMQQHGMMGRNGMHMGMMGNASDIQRLEQAQDFDKAFLEEMIPHHQMAVMMASMLKNGTNRAEMKQLADSIITSQSNEIDQMRQWLRAW